MEHLDTERLSAYIDGELSPDEMRQVEYHLTSCETCRREYEDLRGVATLVRELSVYLPRRELAVDGHGMADGSPVLARIIEFGKPLAVAAIVILIAFAGLRLIGGIGDNDQDDGDQISFSAVQETATAGTDSTNRASDTTAADEPAAGAGEEPAAEDVQDEDEMESAAEVQQQAPAAAMQAQVDRQPLETATPSPQPTIPAPAPTVAPDGDTDDGDSRLTTGIVIATVVAIGAGVAWYMLARSPRRTER